MKYTDNYIDTFNTGIKRAEYSILRKSQTKDDFLKHLLELTLKLKSSKGRIFFFGNGASASFANHMALDWSKNGGVFATSLSDSALITALANDYSYKDCFTEFCKINDVSNSDLIVTISSSGNSPNILSVLEYANGQEIPTFALSGLNPDNKSIYLSTFSLYFPFKTYGMVECSHQLYLHLWLDSFMNIFEWKKTESQNMNYKEFKL